MSDSAVRDVHTIAWSQLTDAQRRRAEALAIASVVLPSAGPDLTWRVAQWIAQGRTDGAA